METEVSKEEQTTAQFDPKDPRILYGGGATGLLGTQQDRK